MWSGGKLQANSCLEVTQISGTQGTPLPVLRARRRGALEGSHRRAERGTAWLAGRRGAFLAESTIARLHF